MALTISTDTCAIQKEFNFADLQTEGAEDV